MANDDRVAPVLAFTNRDRVKRKQPVTIDSPLADKLERLREVHPSLYVKLEQWINSWSMIPRRPAGHGKPGA